MMTKGGFAGNILFVDLTSKKVEKAPLPMDLAEKFSGGLGLTIKLAYDRIKPACDPLSPENPIVIGAGPFVGTNLPAASRVYAVTKFPGSQTVGWCGGGGGVFGCFMKNAGYDHVVIEGRSKFPVYLSIMDDHVEIRDASLLWGKGVEETCESLWDCVGRPAGVISIGQAGENQVSFSMAYIDRFSTLGRGGFGAVMGSKNLKALIVKGTRGIRVANKNSYKALSGKIIKNIRGYPYLRDWQDLGLLKSLPVVSKEFYHEVRLRRIACVSCPIGDKDVIRISGDVCRPVVKCSSSVVNLFTPLIYGLKDYHKAMKCIAILDEYGLDMFEFFGMLSFAKVLHDQGMLVLEAGEPQIDLTSLASLSAWARKISFREGVGDALADGFRGIFHKYGEETKKYAPYTVKGMLTYVGPRGPLSWNLFGTMELGQVMDPRGPHVAASGSPTFFAKRSLDAFPQHLRRMGISEGSLARIIPGMGTPDQNLKIGRLLKYSHQWFAILGSLGICARAQINRFYNAELCAELYEAVTGIKTDLDAMRTRADRSWTLLRMANVREGYTRKDDILPEKWFEEPAFRDYLSEQPVTPEMLERMIDDYYDEQGWDIKTGIPTLHKLEELGLS
jgi:aldehyde:ferredoxin oxidoreductase